MPFKISQLWSAPEVNPYNKKARSIPILNPIDKYGRVFFFSWMGFFLAFWSWYAFPPLLSLTIKKDLNLTQNQIANSNIVALTATLLMRAACGPLCDRFGPRLVFVGCLLAGAIPTALAGTIHNASGLIVLRFFVGILGTTFVPCQVWSTGFFDKNVVGTANALTGGWGNAGGGVTYFVMPAIFDSLIAHSGLKAHVAWRVAFIVPFLLITATAFAMLLFGEDTPNGKWADRGLAIQSIDGRIVDTAGSVVDKPLSTTTLSTAEKEKGKAHDTEIESQTGEVTVIDAYQHETVQKPSFKEAMPVIFSLQTLTLASCYLCSFGAELAINSILGAYYVKNFPKLGQTHSGRWAAMFGLLNIAFRPAGGFIGDLIYKYTNGSLWAKKGWIHFLGAMTGVFLVVIGQTNPHHLKTMIGLIAGMAFFLEAGNGATFALVPHVHPHANGIISGIVGASGNLGGIIFAIIFRYNGAHYSKVFWIIGVMTIAINLSVSWIRPIPKGQIGGR
ncbi:nitrate transporter-like protein [Lepidopterella palustris CBS 459.81]|uniref:Nitrate/nitrite transporter n=1 Tax=Lepidopterella palustris CBS 459.81 TaxID=1314670 RepID=A0A8E2EHC3_9PEZI|nr:nitrate transporter-like protein [Lepidopterella palustris CBS 459.81]